MSLDTTHIFCLQQDLNQQLFAYWPFKYQLYLTCDKCFHRCVIWIKTSFIYKNYGVPSVPNDCLPGTVGSVDVPMFCWCWICWRSLRRWSAVWWLMRCDARRSTKYGYNLLQSNYIIKYDCNKTVLQSIYISKHGCTIIYLKTFSLHHKTWL